MRRASRNVACAESAYSRESSEGLGTEGGFRPPGFRGFQLMQSLAASLDCVR